MVSQEQYEWLRSQRNTLDQLIALLPEEDVFSRRSFERRREQVERELDAYPAPESWPAKAILRFDGNPVRRDGIDAAFMADAVDRFNKVFAGLAVAREGKLSSRGPFPSGMGHKLMITDIARGSFGFQIEEVPVVSSRMDEPIPDVKATLEETMELLSSESSSSIAKSIDSRVASSVISFLDLLEKNGAQCKLSFNDREIEVRSSPDIRLAPPPKPKKKEITWRGHFKGYLPSARQAEFFRAKTRRTIRGKVDPAWRNADEINNLLNRPAKAAVIRTRLGKKTEYAFIGFTLVA